MKKIVTIAAVLLLAGCNAADDKAPAAKAGSLDSENTKFSYAIGLDVGKSLSRIDEKLDMDAFNEGLLTAVDGKESKLSEQEVVEVKQAVFKRQQEAMVEKQNKLAVENKATGGTFMQENASADGVKITKSGLQYKVLSDGAGPKPTLEDTVKVNYEGKLLDDTVFDSSYKRGQSVTFPLASVIKGWQEGLQLMPVGSKYRLFIPSKLAYGEKGASNVIGPNAVLVFDVELLGIENAGDTAK
ncbi:MAG: FKBP-type peptidyl-prolyl cis-trans isomerase [Mariprofundaceae bacterium]|nr:FKBP-type peptidyl-prolyl cis-trans isomerase [Mariprofundaceae bacterium]